MSEPTRYDLLVTALTAHMVENQEGRYVSYPDYAQLRDEKERLERERDNFRNRLDRSATLGERNLNRADQAEAEVERLNGQIGRALDEANDAGVPIDTDDLPLGAIKYMRHELEAARKVVEAAKYHRPHCLGLPKLWKAVDHYDQQCEAGEGVRYWKYVDMKAVWWRDEEGRVWIVTPGDCSWKQCGSDRTIESLDLFEHPCTESEAYEVLGWEKLSGNVASEKADDSLRSVLYSRCDAVAVSPASREAVEIAWYQDGRRRYAKGDTVAGAVERAFRVYASNLETSTPQPPTGPFYDHEGNEYLLTGEYETPKEGDYWVSTYGFAFGPNAKGLPFDYPAWILRPVNKPCTCRSEQHDYQDGPVYVWLHNGTWECRFFSDDTRKAHGAGRNPAEAVRNMIGVMGSQKRSEAAIKAEALREAAEKLASVYGHQHQQQEAKYE